MRKLTNDGLRLRDLTKPLDFIDCLSELTLDKNIDAEREIGDVDASTRPKILTSTTMCVIKRAYRVALMVKPYLCICTEVAFHLCDYLIDANHKNKTNFTLHQAISHDTQHRVAYYRERGV